MPVERRGQVTGIEAVRVNGKPEELDGLDGRRQLLVGGTSRISREAYVRICERLGVKFPGATRRWETGRRSGVSARAHPRLYKVAARSKLGPGSFQSATFEEVAVGLMFTRSAMGWRTSRETTPDLQRL
jgi:hypothetical protein